MGKVDVTTREAVINVLAESQMESFQQYSNRDFYELAKYGLIGYNKCTDEELLDELKSMCGYDEVAHYHDSQLSALHQLLHAVESEVERSEVQSAIDARIRFVESTMEPNCDPEDLRLIREMEMQIAIHNKLMETA